MHKNKESFNNFLQMTIQSNKADDFNLAFKQVNLRKLYEDCCLDWKFAKEATLLIKSKHDDSEGLYALFVYRLAHQIFLVNTSEAETCNVARKLSEMARVQTGIEIHPAAKIKVPVFFESGKTTIIGEQSIINKNTIIRSGAILGANFVGNTNKAKKQLRRHPTIGENVIIETNAMILGNIKIDSNSRVQANSLINQ